MARRVKKLVAMMASHWILDCVHTAMLPIPPLANGLGKAAEDSTSTGALATHMGDPDEAFGFNQQQHWPFWPHGK